MSGRHRRPGVPPFHERFNLETHMDTVRAAFVNRILNGVEQRFPPLKDFFMRGESDQRILRHVAQKLGVRFSESADFSDYVDADFGRCLLSVEALYEGFGQFRQTIAQRAVDELVDSALALNELDVGVRWQDGVFWQSGAELLDETLVNEPLQWLSDKAYESVLGPFKKGLSHYLEATASQEKLADTVTDMYEAVEAMAKVVTGRANKDLSANAELFVSRLKLSGYFGRMLREYIEYANGYRHAVKPGEIRDPPMPEEVEAFVYTTGLFIRLAIQRLRATIGATLSSPPPQTP